MGFMDKAKQMAEQAQQKIEETQKQFNESQAAKSQGGSATGVRYDEHGRPIPAEPAAEPPASEPAVAEGVSVPQPPAEDAQPAEPPPAAPKEGMNASPDPFKPLQ